jgi:hypothetical protein
MGGVGTRSGVVALSVSAIGVVTASGMCGPGVVWLGISAAAWYLS